MRNPSRSTGRLWIGTSTRTTAGRRPRTDPATSTAMAPPTTPALKRPAPAHACTCNTSPASTNTIRSEDSPMAVNPAMGLSSLLIVFVLAGDVLHVQAWAGAGLFSAGVVGGAIAVLVAGSWRARRPAGRRGGGASPHLPPPPEGVPLLPPSDPPPGPTLPPAFSE